MSPHHLGERGGERRHGERSPCTHATGQVVERGARLELLQEPEAALREGKRKRRARLVRQRLQRRRAGGPRPPPPPPPAPAPPPPPPPRPRRPPPPALHPPR